MKQDIEKIFRVNINYEVTMVLMLILLMLVFKYLIASFRRDPRLVKFAASLPGPPALPLIGNGFDFLIGGINNIPKNLLKYGQTYGQTYRLWLGNDLLVGMANVDDLQAIFSNPNTINKSVLLKPYTDFFEMSIFSMKSETWRQNRKIIQPTLSKQVAKMAIPTINTLVRKYIDIMQKHLDGPEFDLLDYLPYLATDSYTQSLLSIELDWKTKHYYDFHHILNLADEMIVPRIFMPHLKFRWIGEFKYSKEITAAKIKLKQFIKEIVLEKAAEFEKKSQEQKHSEKSLISAVLEIRQKSGFHAPFASQINDVNTLATVSSHTTSATNSVLLVAIAIHPDIQEKLYNEIHDLFGDDDRPVTYEDTLKLPYLDQVIKETMRRFTVIPFFFRNVEADTDIGSMVIPKGTQIMIRAIDVHMDPRWYPNPLEFNPENFSPEAVAKRPKYTFLGFSAGVRDCVGKYYAEMSMRLTIVELVRHFKFYTSTKTTDIDSIAAFTTNVPGGYRVSVKRRECSSD